MMKPPNFTPRQRTIARAVVLRPAGVLVQRKFRSDRGDYFGLPGGAREGDENLLGALQRECREELGAGVLAPRLVAVADYRRRSSDGSDVQRLECIFGAAIADDYVPGNGPRPDRHQVSVEWLPTTDLDGARFEPPFLHSVIEALMLNPHAFLGYIGGFEQPRQQLA